MSTARLLVSAGGREPSEPGASPHTLAFACTPALLRTASGEGDLFLFMRFHYRVVRSGDRGSWRVQAAAYYYGFDDVDGREILAYHWHPGEAPAVPFPHLHWDTVRSTAMSWCALAFRLVVTCCDLN